VLVRHFVAMVGGFSRGTGRRVPQRVPQRRFIFKYLNGPLPFSSYFFPYERYWVT
jgi:hypothetical protein